MSFVMQDSLHNQKVTPKRKHENRELALCVGVRPSQHLFQSPLPLCWMLSRVME